MVIVMRSGAGEDQIHAVIDRLNAFGFDVHRSSGLNRTVLGAIGTKPEFDVRHIASLDGVDVVHRVTAPYERILRSPQDDSAAWVVAGSTFGAGRVAVIVSVPLADPRPEIARAVVRAGADAVSIPATDPDALQRFAGVPVLLEVAHGGELGESANGAAGIRLTGAAMFDRDLRHRVAGFGVPVIVDRAPGSTLQDWLLAADDLLAVGGVGVALCDAGSHTLDPGQSLAPDIAALAFARVRTGLPVLADPGRALADPEVAFAAACAAVAAGARGIVLGLRDKGSRPDDEGLAAAATRLRAIAGAAA